MGLWNKIKYWPIWYDQKSLLLLAIALLAVFSVSAVSLYFSFQPTPEFPETEPPTSQNPPAPISTPPLSSPTTEEDRAEPTAEQTPEPEPQEDTKRESLAECETKLFDAQSRFDFAKAAEKSADDALDRQKRDVESIAGRLSAARTQLSNATIADRARQERRVEDLEDDLEEANQDFTRAEERFTQSQTATDETRRSLADAKDACRNLDLLLVTGFRISDIVSNDGETRPFISDCPGALTQVRQEVDRAEKARERLEDDLKDEREDLNDLENDLSVAEQRLTALANATDDDAERAQEDVVESFAQRVERQESVLQDLEEEIEDAAADVREAEDIEDEVRDICEAQGFVERTFAEEAERIASMSMCTDAVIAADALVERADDVLDAAEKERDELAEDLTRAHLRLERSEMVLRNLTNSNASTTEINRAEDRRDAADQDRDDLQRDFDNAEDVVDDAKENVAAARLARKRVEDRCGRS
ncbi:MAG TPA: hypothetical protein VJK52_04140 [Candidatus Nanoarchaeia archaeon]|nr:hypothetical protein [Candidatus Nanoarchaeia archaeon]